MSTNISKKKRDDLLDKIKQIRAFIAAAPQDENTGNLLSYLSELEKDVNGKKYGLVFEEHREEIDEVLDTHTPVLTEEADLFIDHGGQMNFLLEGDNLAALKLLEKTHRGKIDLIYIDPPYNRGKTDFVYDDDFVVNEDTFRHSKWISFMKSRLEAAKRLLTEAGLVFISIDDNEVENLRKIGDEIFGESNFVNQIIWHKKYGAANDAKYLSDVHDYILLFCKNKEKWHPNLFERPAELNAKYKNPDNDPRGPWIATNLSVKTYSSTNDYVIKSPAGLEFTPPPSRCWSVSKERYEEMLADNRITFGTDGLSRPYKKTFLSEVQQGIVPTTVWSYDDAGHNIGAKSELRDIFKEIRVPFDTPKPTKLIKRIIKMAETESCDDIILDFFSGSGTTADAVMQLNSEDRGKRKYILIQLKEETLEKSIARMEGYKNICEIGKERIRRAGQKIKEENPLTTQDLDIGFRVLKCDSSNMEDVYFTPKEYMDKQQSLFIDNIKKDRSDEDLLFDAMLKLDTPLSSKIEKITIAGKTVYNVAQGHLMACFDKNVTDEVITAIAKEMPSYFVMRDSSQADDSVAINFEQIFNTYSPQTVRRVL